MARAAVASIIVCACASAPVERLSAEEVLGRRDERPRAEPLASTELLEELKQFVETAERLRSSAPRGAPMPPALAAAWSQVVERVETFTTQPQATALDLVRARLWLQTALEADGSRFGDVPTEVAMRAQRCLANLSLTLAARTRGRRLPTADPATFSWPVEPVVVTSPFGERLHPVHGELRFHAGVDLEASRAQPVTAAAAGVVAFAGWNSGHGKQVELQHDAHVSTRYSHLAGWAVQPGETVKRGDLIGWAGKTGTATGVHLHFELRRDGEAIDPEAELPGPGAGMMVWR